MKTQLSSSVGRASRWSLAAALATGLVLTFAPAAQADADAGIAGNPSNVPYLMFPQMAETFTAQHTGQLFQVSLDAASNYYLMPTSIEIWDVAGGAPSQMKTSTLVPTAYNTSLSQRTFTYNPKVAVVAGKQYAIVTRTNLNNYFRWGYNSFANTNPADVGYGRMFYRMSASGSWGGPLFTANSSFYFQTWVDTAVQNRPPVVALDNPLGTSVSEGTAPTMTGTYSDPNGGSVSLQADYGQVTPASGTGGTWSWTGPTADEGGTPSMVKVTGTNTAGLSTSVSFPLSVQGVAPTATITTDPASLPEGSSITLLGAGHSVDPADQAAGFSFAWNVTKDGSPYQSSSGSSLNLSVADEGTYVVSLSAKDDGGLTGPEAQMTIVGAEVIPTARITGVSPADPLLTSPLVIAPNETLNFTGSFADSAPESHTFRWDFGDGASSTTLSASHAYGAAGSYTATLTVKDDEGVANTATTTVTVQTTQQSIAAMIAYVQGLKTLNGGQQNSLIAKLNAASAASARGDSKAASNQLNALLNELAADLKTGKISTTAYNALRADVHAIQGAIGTYNRFLEWWPLVA